MTQKFSLDQFLKWDDEKPPVLAGPATPAAGVARHVEPSEKSNAPLAASPSLEELRAIGHEIRETLRDMVPPHAHATYFSETFNVSDLRAQSIEFLITTSFIHQVIEKQYLSVLQKAVLATLGRAYSIEFKVLGARARTEEPVRRSNTVKSNTFVIQDLIPTAEDQKNAIDSRVIEQTESTGALRIDGHKKFDNFVVGPSNNLAHASALAVSRDPGQIYPSLYLYGNSGLGKSHLIHAVANNIAENHPNLRVIITTGNALMVELVESFNKQLGMNYFKKKYTEGVDVLIIDDIHGLKGKEGTQEQFFHIFNELTERKKQLIFTSDKLPREIDRLEERIRTRLSSALVVEVQLPDLETRIAILKSKAQEKDLFISDEIIDLIAKCVKTSIRDLEGCLTRLKAYCDIMNVDIDLETARQQLKLTEEVENQKLLTPDSITKAVANYYKIPLGDIRGKTKTKDIVVARQVAMYLIHQHLRKTLLEIAHFFGKKDHTTPMHSLDVVKKRLKTDQQFGQQLLDIENSF